MDVGERGGGGVSGGVRLLDQPQTATQVLYIEGRQSLVVVVVLLLVWPNCDAPAPCLCQLLMSQPD